jgi:hypothetical protein
VVLRGFAVVVLVWWIWLLCRRGLLHLRLWWNRTIWLGSAGLDRLLDRLNWSRQWRRGYLLRCWRRRRGSFWGRRWLYWFGRFLFLLPRQNGRQLVDVRLEEFQLFLACGSSCDNLHDSLQLGICASPRGKHVYDGVGRGRCGCLRRRRCLHRLGRLWRPWLGLLLYGLAALVLCVLVGLVVIVVRPWSIWRWCRSLLLHRLAYLARAIESDRQRVRFYDKLHTHSVSTDLGEVLE